MQTDEFKQEIARLKKQLVKAYVVIATGQIVALLALLVVLKYVLRV